MASSPPDSPPSFEDVLTWTEDEAMRVAASQLGTSACGATAALNVVTALDAGGLVDASAALTAVVTRQRDQSTRDVSEYLLSRRDAGCTHVEILDGVSAMSGGRIVGRFFASSPGTMPVARWLASWMRRGAVAVAVLNVQKVDTHADAWHHQMVRGVTTNGELVLLTNPVESISSRRFEAMLHSPSVLRIRACDVLSRRWDPVDGRRRLSEDFHALGVPAQLDRLYEMQAGVAITIPASYKAGLCLFARADSPVWHSLQRAPELAAAAVAAPPPSVVPPSTLVVFDYDWSLINCNSDTFVVEQLRPGLVKNVRAYLDQGMQWTETIDRVVGDLFASGVTLEEIVECLANVPIQGVGRDVWCGGGWLVGWLVHP
jgi:hypothetical protein